MSAGRLSASRVLQGRCTVELQVITPVLPGDVFAGKLDVTYLTGSIRRSIA